MIYQQLNHERLKKYNSAVKSARKERLVNFNLHHLIIFESVFLGRCRWSINPWWPSTLLLVLWPRLIIPPNSIHNIRTKKSIALKLKKKLKKRENGSRSLHSQTNGRSASPLPFSGPLFRSTLGDNKIHKIGKWGVRNHA